MDVVRLPSSGDLGVNGLLFPHALRHVGVIKRLGQEQGHVLVAIPVLASQFKHRHRVATRVAVVS